MIYFDSASWSDVDREEDMNTDSLNECGIGCSLKENCNVFKWNKDEGICQLGFSCERSVKGVMDGTHNTKVYLKDGIAGCDHAYWASWGSWAAWSSCSRTCKCSTCTSPSKSRTKSRTCINSSPSDGGKTCSGSGSTSSSTSCNTHPCPAKSEDCYEYAGFDDTTTIVHAADLMTRHYCLNYCLSSAYDFAAITNGTICGCTNTNINLNKKTSIYYCDVDCKGEPNTKRKCGGDMTWTIYVLESYTIPPLP